MQTTRREFVRLGAAAGGALGLGLTPDVLLARGAPATAPVLPGRIEKAQRSLRILILGGTGFTGPHQVSYALARGHKLTLFNRGRREIDWPGEVEEVTGDRNEGDLRSLEGREWDVCIDNPTTLPFWVRDAGRVLQGRVGQYIFISTISVYADNSRPGMDETTRLAAYEGADPMQETQQTMSQAGGRLYGPLKVLSEREGENWFPGRTTVIRPGLIVGPRDTSGRFTYWPARIDRGGEVLAPGDGEDPVQIIDARDLAEWTIRMAEQGATGIYNATGPGSAITMAEVLYGIRAATTSNVRFTWVPIDFLAQHQVRGWSDMPIWMAPRDDNAGWGRVSIRRALERGLTFRPLAVTAADTITWLKAQSPEDQVRLVGGLRPERETEVLAAWHAARRG